MSDDIIVSGIACRFPDANTPSELWDNVLAKRKAFRRIPKERLDIADYDPNHSLYEDSIYINKAAVLTDYQFDRLEFNISGGAYRSADLTHWLALECAKEALVDSGVLNNNTVDEKKIGVIVGNTLTGDISRSSSLRLRWPYVRKVLTNAFENKGMENNVVRQLIEEAEQLYKAPFEVPSEETLSGGLANTIAGRICNYFDFGGGGYTIDGACSSSLLAVVNACTALESGELDVVIAGGVDLSIDPFELVGFSRSNALAKNQMAVYSNLANGFLPGEGCGMLVLTKVSFAEKAELKQYASIKGWGISSDGKGGLTRPEVEGQKLALERCYKKAGYSPGTVKLFEGHGTGTPVGDSVELKALNLARDGSPLTAVLGSIKSNIGHTKAAAGSAGLIKIIKALENKVLPPHTETENKNIEFESVNNSLSLLDTSAAWPDDAPLRAGVSSFGFGGINVHISIERELRKGIKSKGNFSNFAKYSFQDAEAFFFAADTDIELIEILTRLAKRAVSMSLAEMADCSASMIENIRGNRLRAAFIASDPEEIKSKSEALIVHVSLGKEVIDSEKNIHFSSRLDVPEIGYMFTGQGGPIRLNGGAAGKRFKCASDQYSSLNSPLIDDRTTRSAQNAITQSQLATLKILNHLGIEAKHGIGHSIGELSALHWAKALDGTALTELVDARGLAMTEFAEHDGSMAAVNSSADVIREYINDGIVIACINSPIETVVAGKKKDLEVFIAKIRGAGITASFLNVAGAFHSPLMKKAASQFENILRATDICSPVRPVYSTVTGVLIENGIDLKDHLIKQLTKPVLFDSAFKNFSDRTNVIIEIGPGRTLSALVKNTTQTPVLSTDSSSSSISSLLDTLAGLFVLGTTIDFEKLFSNRYLKKFDLSRTPKFISNPCESYKSEIVPSKTKSPKEKNDVIYDLERTNSDLKSILSTLKNAIAEKTELPVESIDDQADFLIDLHLNSITVAEIIARTCRALQLPPPNSSNEFSNANVSVAAKILFEFQTSGINPSDRAVELIAVEQWVRAFRADWILSKSSMPNYEVEKVIGEWEYFSLPSAENVPPYIKNIINTLAGNGSIFFLGKLNIVTDELIEFVLEKLKLLTTSGIDKLVLVQSGLGYGSVFKSFFLENKKISTLLIDLSNSLKPLEDLSHEISSLDGFSEIAFDSQGRRLTKEFSPYQERTDIDEHFINAHDTVLITGGGKGITAECAFQLAKKYSCKLVILGRSDVKVDEQLQSTLDRLSAHKIEYRYHSVDITDFSNLKKTLNKCEKELGPISVLLHGAGANEPKRIEKLSYDDFEFCNAVKVQALKNILELLKSKELKAVFTFGSIIAQSGMSGEAHYGLANDLMARALEDYELKHAHCRTICFDWSVWSGIGMGETLGSLEYLRSLGVMPIIIDKGVERFISLIQDTNTPRRVLVAGRFGTLETLQLKKKTLPMKRFLDSVKLYYPKIELIVEPKINSFDDLYLFDHELDGTLLFPAVLSIEALTQVAMALSETEQLPNVSNLQIKLPIIVDKYKGVKIRVSALKISDNEVGVEIRTDSDSYSNICVSAMCHFNDQDIIKKYLNDCKNESEHKETQPELEVSEFYKSLMFQAGRFQNIQEFKLLTAKHCRALIKASSEHEKWFGEWMPQGNYFGSPGVNDSIIHFVQTCVPHKRLVPISVKHLVINAVSGPYLVDAKEIFFSENTYCFDIIVRNQKGEIHQVWEQIKFRSVANLSLNFEHSELLENSIQRIVADATGQDVSFYFSLDTELSKQSRKETCVAKVSDTYGELTSSASGRPEFTSGHFASISHTGAITVLAVSKRPIGCDIEIVEHREQRLWHDMLGEAAWQYRDIFNGCDLIENESVKMTRLWGLTEGYKKITNENLEYVDSNSVKAVSPNTIVVMTKDLIVISGFLNVRDTETIITIFLKEST